MFAKYRNSTRLLLLLACAAPLVAQGVSTELTGRVEAKDGKPVAGALVLIRNLETGLTRTVQSDPKGSYLALALPVGPYSVTVSKAGFQSAGNLKVDLILGGQAPLRVHLAPASEATVEVVAVEGKVDGYRTTVATFISPDALRELPVSNRSFTALATLTPNATTDPHNGNLAIAGQRGVNTSINIDGGDANEPFFAGAMGSTSAAPFMVSMESIREYQVIAGGASAEFGRMGGGYLNAITKSGTNEGAGTFWYFDFPQSLVAKQPNLSGVPGSNAVLNFKKSQFGFNYGGAIIKDKLFYFLNYDGQRYTQPMNFGWGGTNPVTLDPSNTNAAVLLGAGSNYDTYQNLDTLFARIDWIVNTDHVVQVNIKHNQFTADYGTAQGVSVQTVSYGATEPDITRNLSLIGQWDWTISGNWINMLRFNYTTDNLPRSTRSQNPLVSIANVGSYGANQYPREFADSRTQITETLTYVTNTLQVKGGFDSNNICTAETFSGGYMGAYSFTSLANFQSGDWFSYTQRFAGPGSPGQNGWTSGAFAATEQQQAMFVQADVEPVQALKVSFGLRYDRQTHPDFPILNYSNPQSGVLPLNGKIPFDTSVSPRFNLTWTPAADPTGVLRFSAGRYVSVTPSIFLDQAYASNGSRQESITFKATDPGQDGIPYGAAFNAAAPFSFNSTPTGGTIPKPQVISFAPDFKNPRTDQVTYGFDQALGSWLLSFNAIYAVGSHLERLTDLNLGTPTADATGREIFPATRPNTNYGQILEYASDAQSQYHSYTIGAKYQDPSSPWTGQVYYTYSINKDDDSNERTYNSYGTQNPQQLGSDWGYADSDRRNVLTGLFSFMDKKWSGVTVGLTVKYLSGLPYSIVANGADPANIGNSGTARLYVNGVDTGRNTQRTSSTTDLDLKLARDWRFGKSMKLTASAEIFNLFNRADTYQKLSGVALNKTAPDVLSILDSPTVTSTPRQAQLGLRFAF